MVICIVACVASCVAGIVVGKNLGSKAKAEIAQVSAVVKTDAAVVEKKV
jgi:hypothetical protein